MSSRFFSLATGCGLSLSSVTALAAPTFCFGENQSAASTNVAGAPVMARDAFLSRLVGVGIEGFEGFSNLTAAPP